MSEEIIWDESYSVGVAELDQHHQHLFDLTNRLGRIAEGDNSKEDLSNMLDEILDYLAEHFKCEERYMESWDYPDLSAHRQEHWTFIMSAMNFVKQYYQGNDELLAEVHIFLKDWLIEHVMGSDQQYKKFRVSNNL